MEAKYPGRSKDVISIINASAEKAKERIDAQLKISDEANFVILATPATIKSMAYPNQLAKLYNRDLKSEPPKFIQNERWYKQKGSTVDNITQVNKIHLANSKTISIYQVVKKPLRLHEPYFQRIRCPLFLKVLNNVKHYWDLSPAINRSKLQDEAEQFRLKE